MTKYREILRLHSLGLSQKDIAGSCGVSKKTVNKVLKAAREKNIFWPLSDTDTDAVLSVKLFPKAPKVSSTRQMPDFSISAGSFEERRKQETALDGIVAACHQNGIEPLIYSPFCYYIRRRSSVAVQPCTSLASPASRLRWTGPEIRRT